MLCPLARVKSTPAQEAGIKFGTASVLPQSYMENLSSTFSLISCHTFQSL